MTTFLFLRITHDLLSTRSLPNAPGAAVMGGEPRSRPWAEIPVPVPPTCVGLPDRDTKANAPPPSSRRLAPSTSNSYRTACAGRSKLRAACAAWERV
jgi:hypothetical protein